MIEAEGLPREELYRLWHEWVTTHLGHDRKFATAAAAAAANASHQGRGFNASIKVAKAAWNEAAEAGDPGEADRSVTTNTDKEPRDAWIGVFGALGGNVFLFVLCVLLLSLQAPGTSLFVAAFVVACVLNVAVPIIFTVVRPRIALYMLLGDGIGLILALVIAFGLFLWFVSTGAGAFFLPS